MPATVRTGLEVLKAKEFVPLKNLSVGLLTNPTAVDGSFRHLIDLCFEAGVNVKRIFGPEHGLFSTAQDMVGVTGERHAIEVISLYGDTFDSLRPREQHLRDLDLLVFDIQDIGSRYYTYVWTLALSMEIAAKTGTRVMVLDRPNPITGTHVEGGGIEPHLRSFVGWYELPNRHGLTAGEIATLVARDLGGPELEVVRMENYDRGLRHEQTGAPWVIPSPNMPTPETALVYPGQAILEGTNLSEGRGCTRPFEIFGAPYVNGAKLAAALEKEDLPGAAIRPLHFQPTFQKHAGRVCGGLQIHVTDRESYRPVRTSLAILRHARALWPKEFAWRTEPYEFRGDVPAVDLLTGQARVRELIDAGAPVAEIVEFFESTGDRARKNREESLLYKD
jgi:uncharacterized protein YbbC (DUF1343 family)